MNNPNLCDKDYVSVLPRIIDRDMQFTKESIENSIDKNNNNTSKNNKQISTKNNSDTISNKNTIEDHTPSMSIFYEYRYTILIIIIIIICVIIIYLVYRYYNKKEDKKNDNELSNNKDITNDDKGLAKQKSEKVKEYISTYIMDDNEIEDNEIEDNDIENEDYNEEINNIEDTDNTYNNSEIENNNYKNLNKYEVKQKNINKPTVIETQNIEISNIHHIVGSILDFTEIDEENLVENENVEIIDENNENNENEENYEDLLNDADDDEINTNYNSVFNSSIIKCDEDSNVSNENNKDDDLAYFQKFNKKT